MKNEEELKSLGKQTAHEALRECHWDMMRAIRLLEYFHIHYRNLPMHVKMKMPYFKIWNEDESEIILEGIEQLINVKSIDLTM